MYAAQIKIFDLGRKYQLVVMRIEFSESPYGTSSSNSIMCEILPVILGKLNSRLPETRVQLRMPPASPFRFLPNFQNIKIQTVF